MSNVLSALMHFCRVLERLSESEARNSALRSATLAPALLAALHGTAAATRPVHAPKRSFLSICVVQRAHNSLQSSPYAQQRIASRSARAWEHNHFQRRKLAKLCIKQSLGHYPATFATLLKAYSCPRNETTHRRSLAAFDTNKEVKMIMMRVYVWPSPNPPTTEELRMITLHVYPPDTRRNLARPTPYLHNVHRLSDHRGSLFEHPRRVEDLCVARHLKRRTPRRARVEVQHIRR